MRQKCNVKTFFALLHENKSTNKYVTIKHKFVVLHNKDKISLSVLELFFFTANLIRSNR